MDVQTLRERTKDGLKQDLKEVTERLQTLAFKLSSSQMKNVRELRILKRTIARIQTIINETEQVTVHNDK